MKIRKVTDVLGLKVFTDNGDYFGEIEEANIVDNKIDGWRIRVDSSIVSLFGGAKGVIVPHRFVRAMSDICLIHGAAMPSREDDLTGEDVELNASDLI